MDNINENSAKNNIEEGIPEIGQTMNQGDNTLNEWEINSNPIVMGTSIPELTPANSTESTNPIPELTPTQPTSQFQSQTPSIPELTPAQPQATPIPEPAPVQAQAQATPIPEPAPVQAQVQATPIPEPAPVQAQATPIPEPAPVQAQVQATPMPEPAPVQAQVQATPIPEPAPVQAQVQATPIPEPAPVQAQVQATPIPEPAPVQAQVQTTPIPEPAPVQAQATPIPEPAPVQAQVQATPIPEPAPVQAQVQTTPIPEPAPVQAQVQTAPIPEPAPVQAQVAVNGALTSPVATQQVFDNPLEDWENLGVDTTAVVQNSLNNNIGQKNQTSNLTSASAGVMGAIADPNLDPLYDWMPSNDKGLQSSNQNSEKDPSKNPTLQLFSNQENNKKPVINDEELLKAYIGDNFEKIVGKPFNFAGLFLTSLYLFYRKMFLYGIIYIIISMLFQAIFSSLVILLILSVLCGACVNQLYVSFAMKNIKNIKAAHPDADMKELKTYCINKGGTSFGAAILGAFISIALSTILIVIIGFGKAITYYQKNSKDLTPKNETYNGELSIDTDVNILEKYNISIPDSFQEEFMNDESSASYYYAWQPELDETSYKSCKFTLSEVLGYSSSKNLANQMYDYFINEQSTVQYVEKTINNNKWYVVQRLADNQYLTDIDGKVLLFDYMIEEGAPAECINFEEQILKSISKK